MKYKLLAFLLALTVMSWAQSATTIQTPAQGQNSEKAADPKAACVCCDKTSSADHKEGHACLRHNASAKDKKDCCAGKNSASCCNSKEAKACMKNDKPDDCCTKGTCGEGKEMNCCSGKKNDQKAQNCCEGRPSGEIGPFHHIS